MYLYCSDCDVKVTIMWIKFEEKKTYPLTLILNFYNVYTNMYIHHTLLFMNKKEQYIVNNKHVYQERS